MKKATGWDNDLEVDIVWDILLNKADGEYLAGFNDGSSLQRSCVSDAMLSVDQTNSFEGVEYAHSKWSKRHT